MMDITECLTDQTPILVTSDNSYPKRFFLKPKKKEPKLYFKDFNHAEFIGEELCLIKNIECTHYFIAGLGNYSLNQYETYKETSKKFLKYQIASFDFKKDNHTYKTILDYHIPTDGKSFEEMVQIAKTEENEKKLCMDLLNLLALDIYMGQTDRFFYNFLLKEDEKQNVRLAPIYDFEYALNTSYLDRRVIHSSDVYTFHNIEECREFIKKYPIFRDLLASYLTINLKEVIERAYDKRNLRIPNNKWKFYQEFEENRKNLIKKMIR